MINWIKKIMNNRKYKKVLKENSNKDIVIIDIGSTSIKMAYKGELINFKSSIRKILDTNEITPATKNYVKVNEEYYMIGEAERSNETTEFKVDRKYMNIAILYGLKVFRDKGIEVSNNLKLNVLLPFNEIQYKDRLEKNINGLYKVGKKQIALTINKVLVEGECSSVFYQKQYKTKGNVIVINVGGKTTDSLLLDSQGNRQKIVSIDLGTQYLLSQIVKFTKAPTSNILNSWIVDGYKFDRKELAHLKEAGTEFISNIWNDIFSGIIKVANPNNTTILLVGGGANLIKDSIENAIPEGYKVKTLTSFENVFSDLLGGMLLSNSPINIQNDDDNSNKDEFTTTKQIEEKEVIEKVAITEEKTIAAATTEKKTKYQIFVELFEAGLSNEEILEKADIAKQTLKNYKTKYNKELKLA